MQVTGTIDESRPGDTYGQTLFLPGSQSQSLCFELGHFIGIGRRKRSVFGGRHFTRFSMDTGRTTMYDALYLTLSLAGVEQDARTLDVRAIVEFGGCTGMIESAH